MTILENLTVNDLERMIDARIDERLISLLGQFELSEDALFDFDFDAEAPDTRTWEQVKQDIERDRWTPPPGAKSSLALLREART
ncbi:MAG: hypothetical protein H7Y11_09400 [Armatimonadetes bacterium]|nr:hypothetical protein [Anaerolineae bacterium]